MLNVINFIHNGNGSFHSFCKQLIILNDMVDNVTVKFSKEINSKRPYQCTQHYNNADFQTELQTMRK